MISKLLVANRGEIARRIMRTCREMGIGTVAVFSEADADAPFVAEADQAVLLGPAPAAESYLVVEKILAAAEATGADAIHPGYGFLAENAEFARAVTDAGLVWVGPPVPAIEAMGSKLGAKEIMSTAGVPTLPSIRIDPADEDGVAKAADDIGYPVLVKASAGGGGKGMRIVDGPSDLQAAAEGAAREAAASFGDDTLFIEKYLPAPRHVEVQIFGDESGEVVSLYERECSIQRRHQKIIEESPSPAVDDDLRTAFGEAAVAAGKAVGYVGAGTVEFLLDADGSFYFLEVNTRLQVEHPVTEEVTGLDLVRLQLEVAQGHPLPDEAHDPGMDGHSIEVRLYAEDPTNGFLPVTGTVTGFALPDTVRVDSAVEAGSEVSVHYDPMIAKVISWAPTRTEAALVLASALRKAEIHGLVTNRELLVRILGEEEFLAGATDTHYLERHDPAELGRPLVEGDALARHAVAAALYAQSRRRKAASTLASIPTGFRNSPSQLQVVSYDTAAGRMDVGYRFDRSGPTVEVDGELLEVRLVEEHPDGVVVRFGDVQAPYAVRSDGDVWHVDGPEGGVSLTQLSRHPGAEEEGVAGSLLAPMPGRVVKVDAEVGAEVGKGQVLIVVEAMKMEHSVRAPADGTVAEVRVSVGDQVDADAVLAVVDEGE